MDKEQAINIVRQYKAALSDTYKGAKVLLYGSYSKGTAREDSDIDVAIIIPSVRGGNWFTLVPPLWTCARKINSLIEPVLMVDGEHSPLYDDVMHTGVMV